jgi:hypothetical protein
LGTAAIGKFEEDQIQHRRVDTVVIPHRVEVARLVLRGHETAVQPDARTPCLAEEGRRIEKTVQQRPPNRIPSEPINHLSPQRRVSPIGK